MGSLPLSIPAFLDKIVDFPDGASYEIVRPLTDFRKCHDGKPLESRIVFLCKRIKPEPIDQEEAEFVMKVKVQAPDNKGETQQPPVEGPSTTTKAELKALQVFTEAKLPSVPHLVSWKKAVQGDNGIFPGGYINYIMITKMPGQDLLAKSFWGMAEEQRREILQKFLEALRSIYALGIEPCDCALRNVLWESETKSCSIVDFELWREATETFPDETKELQRWGLARWKVPVSWWAEWNRVGL